MDILNRKLLVVQNWLVLLHTKIYHFLTQCQLEQDILNFAEGLRVSGILPDEKVALFADNSCRWLVADQGKTHRFIVLISLNNKTNVDFF